MPLRCTARVPAERSADLLRAQRVETRSVMEAPLQIVGCLLSLLPADPLIDGFVTAARRERAVVTARNAHSATFVKFNAADARLVAMACEAAVGPGGQSLHFGFACAMKRPAPSGQDAWSVSNRCIAQARDLAAAARGRGAGRRRSWRCCWWNRGSASKPRTSPCPAAARSQRACSTCPPPRRRVRRLKTRRSSRGPARLATCFSC